MRSISAQMTVFGEDSPYRFAADVNHDGLVNFADYTDIRSAAAQTTTIRQAV